MLNPHHVEALAYERQRELLESAARLRAGKRHHPAGRGSRPDDRGGVLATRIAAWFARLPRTRRPSRRRQPTPAVTPSRRPDATAAHVPSVPNAA